MRVYEVFQGEGQAIPFAIADGLGKVITTYTGAEALATDIWPGGNRESAFAAATTWIEPTAGSVLITISAAQSAELARGRYQIYSTLTEAGADPVAILKAWLDVLPTPATELALPTYTTYQDLLDYAPWIGDLAPPEGQAGFLRQQGMAREWLDEIIVQRYGVGDTAPMIGSPGFGNWSMFGSAVDFAPSRYLRDRLAEDTLIVQPKTREICACRALFYILRPQLGCVGDTPYRDLAADFSRRATSMVKTYRAEIDLNHDGWADIIVRCGSTNLR
jgi:hypothetical protein